MASLRKTGESYVVCFRLGGRQVQRSLKTTDAALAKTLLAEITGRLGRLARREKTLSDGMDPIEYIVTGREEPPVHVGPFENSAPTTPTTPTTPTIDAAVEEYLIERHSQLAATSRVTERIHLKNVAAALTTLSGRVCRMSLSEIEHDLFRRALLERAKAVSPTTVAKERQTLRGFLNWAERRWQRPGLAMIELPRFKKKSRGDRFLTYGEIEETIARGGLSDAEISKLWSRLYLLPDEITEVLDLVRANTNLDVVELLHLLIAYTGVRRGEVRRLRWDDVDLTRNRITVRSRKQSRSVEETWREIDLHPVLVRALAAYRTSHRQGQFVLSLPGSVNPLTIGELDYHFRRPLRETRWARTITDGRKRVVVRPHVMRHSFASCLAMRGVDQRIIDRFVGHVTPAMARHYQHVAPATRRSAVELLDFGSTPFAEGDSGDAA